jgi:UDP-N-acetylglucosamine 2-epimerase (non-hydrolysing)
MKIHLIAAARPNFMKIAPLYHALRKEKWAHTLIVHTGQHYDLNMSDVFFQDLRLHEPDIHLGIGGGTHAEQTGKVMIAYEKVLLENQPDLVIVVGDVNSTLACTLAASKISYPSIPPGNGPDDQSAADRTDRPAIKKNTLNRPIVAHLEAGLRSFDRTMPEEINRIVTDSLADLLWTPSPDGDENLLREGVDKRKIVRVGNIMIDSLEMLRDHIENQQVHKDFSLDKNTYGLITLHRPSNVDNQKKLTDLCETLIRAAKIAPLVFPVHPRTKNNLSKFGLLKMLAGADGMILTEPINYIRFMSLVFDCRFVITDSGGIQEETTYLGIPCLTLRPNTERPVTVTQGTNKLCTGTNLIEYVESICRGNQVKYSIPELWDGHTAQRIVSSIKKLLVT